MQGNEPICQNGTTNFGPTGPIDQSGPPPEVFPDFPVGPKRKGTKRKGPSHLTSERNFRNV